MKNQSSQSAADRYQELTSHRATFLDKARECSQYTLPYLIPPSGSSSNQELPTPWQSVGAKGVNVMASKLLLSLFPTNTSFFKLQINDGEFTADPQLDVKIKSEVDESLSRMERVINQHIADSQDRVILFSAFKHLVVGGNAAVFLPKGKPLKVYPLSRYVCDRDGNDDVVEILTVESIHRSLLPKQFQATKEQRPNHTGSNPSAPQTDILVGEDEVAVYTWAKRKDNRWTWHQEADGEHIPGTDGAANHEVTPWMVLRFNVVDGENYGRGRIEEYLGDLKSLEGLMQSMVEGSAGLAKLVFLVSPSATIKPQSLAEAANLAVLAGRAEDITVVQANKAADYGPVLTMIDNLTKRLDEAFLVMNVRDSERTTAEEIRATQQELNEQLGGNLGNLTKELLQPYLKRKIHELREKRQLAPLPKGLVFPSIVTGLDGIGRGQDLESLGRFLTIVQETMGPEALQRFIHVPEVLSRLAAAAGIDTVNLVKTAEDLQQEDQKAKGEAKEMSLTGQVGQLAKADVDQQSAAMQLAASQQQQPSPPEQANVPPQAQQSGPPPSP